MATHIAHLGASPSQPLAGGPSSLALVGELRRHRAALVVVLVALVATVLAGCGTSEPTVPPIPVGPPLRSGAPGTAAPPATSAAVAPKGLLAPLPPIGSRTGPRVCERFGSVPVAGGRYEVQNDAWGADTPQCTTAFDTGFSVQADHDKDSGPAAYPSIVDGCNHGTCTQRSPFPRPIADLGDVRSSWAVTTPAKGDYNVAYDVWLDPTARRDGDNTGAELMIWLDHTDRVQPIGSKSATAQLGGARWDVWTGDNNGVPVISYVRQQPTKVVLDLPVSDFVRDAIGQGVVQPNWFLTNLQAGFEPWIGGSGLSTDAFAVTRNGV